MDSPSGDRRLAGHPLGGDPSVCMNVNLSIVQPAGYVHSLIFLDVARALRHGLRRIGLNPILSKNRLRSDCINWILGGHLGFQPALLDRYRCVMVNLEQIGHGGAALPREYPELLRSCPVLDYDPGNLSAYRIPGIPAGLFEFSHVPYLDPSALPIAERPIDLLFYGSVNERRRRLFDRIEAAGIPVTHFDKPIYADERDHYIRNAKAVLNCSFYESRRFEQVRAFHCLSLGTPVVTELIEGQTMPRRYSESLFFFDPKDPEAFFRDRFGSEQFFQESGQRLTHWRTLETTNDSTLRTFVEETRRFFEPHSSSKAEVWRPDRINLRSGKDYRPGWLNLDVDPSVQPDLVLDLSKDVELPMRSHSDLAGDIEIRPGSVAEVFADNVLEHVPDLPKLMTNLLALLRLEGRLVVHVPCEGAPTAWQDPTHVRAFNENSWLYYTDWFWYLNWFDHRFRVASLEWFDIQLKPCDRPKAAFMKVVLEKTETSPWERTVARTMRASFAGIPEDL